MKGSKTVELTWDDIFELKRLSERSRKEIEEGIANRNSMDARFKDDAREAMHARETLERILKQT